jgi:UDP-N-acetylmuramate dehydrogenase
MTKQEVKLKDLAYYATGGDCEVLYQPATVFDLAKAVKEIQANKMPFFLLGGGTNSLVMDEPFSGAVIVFRNLNRLEVNGTKIKVGAGVENSDLASLAHSESLKGAAWMYRLPGQIGGTVRMNARCYGGEISQIVTKVEVVTQTGEIKIYEKADMKNLFKGYKDTSFMKTGEMIAGVEISLGKGDPKEIEEKMKFCESDREGKGQFDFPSCGCVFKNDYSVGVSSGILLDAVGAKKLKHDGAEVSEHHANFVFNKGATSRAIIEISILMRNLVYEKFGVWLEYEMEILGAMPDDLKKQVLLKKPQKLNEAQIKPLREKMQGRL